MWRWLSDAANAVATVVEEVVNAIAEVVSDVVETVGNAIGDAMEAGADALARIPGMGRVGSAVVRWLGRMISAAFDFAASVIKAVGALVGGVLAGVIRFVGGFLSLDPGLAWQGLSDIVNALVGPVVMVVAKAIALLQSIIPLQGRRRPLSEAEIAILRRVYEDALSLFNVRVVDTRAGAGVFGVNAAPFVLGNTIYMKGETDEHVFVHESVHVWQYQHTGSGYISRALGNQFFDSDTNTDLGWQLEVDRGREWREFGGEAQAWFVEDLWEGGQATSGGVVDSSPGVFYDADGVSVVGVFVVGTEDHTELAEDTVAILRAPATYRLSNGLP